MFLSYGVFNLSLVRHYSLPSTTPPAHMMQTSRSFSVGSCLTSLETPFPHQETATGRPPLEQIHPHAWPRYGMYSRGTSEVSPTAQKPAIPIPALSQDAVPYLFNGNGPFTTRYVSPGPEPSQASSWNESHSLSNSGSIHLNYNSYPSSRNASQEAFQSQRVPVSTGDVFGEMPPHFAGMQMPAEYYSNIMPPQHSAFHPLPKVQHNWYQHTSLGSIPQGEPAHMPSQGPFDLRSAQSQRNRSRHNSAADVFPNSSSQEWPYHRYSQPQVHNYYTPPPHSRRNPVLVSPMHSQPISEYTHANDPQNQSRKSSQGSPSGSRQQYHSEEQPRRNEVAAPTFKEEVMNGMKPVQASHSEANNVSNEELGDCLPSYDQLKELATLKEQILNNSSEVETVRRRRTNSLQRESDRNGRSMKTTKRLSLVSVASYNVNGLSATGSAGGLNSTSNHLIPGSGSKGKCLVP